jgi:uncharacterized protein
MTAAENKELVRAAFEAWAQGRASFFSLLADDATWTITGSSAVAGTYTSRRFLDEVIRPIGKRLAGPVRPTVQHILADGDQVAVFWKGSATRTDGKPYENTYSWLMRFRDGKIVEATAFFDTAWFNELWEGASPA